MNPGLIVSRTLTGARYAPRAVWMGGIAVLKFVPWLPRSTLRLCGVRSRVSTDFNLSHHVANLHGSHENYRGMRPAQRDGFREFVDSVAQLEDDWSDEPDADQTQSQN